MRNFHPLRSVTSAAIAGLLVAGVAFAAEPQRDQSGKIDDYNQWKQALGAGTATDPATIVAPRGFKVELLRSAGKDEGSWIALAFDPRGRIFISREDKGILRLQLAENQREPAHLETINDTLLECRGLLWAYDGLYANANNSKGLYRLRDVDGDDRFEDVKLLKATEGNVGHGRNDLTLGPDGMIYSIHGDDVRLPADYQPAGSPLAHVQDARLLPCEWDRTLFNASMKLPGGYVARTDRDGTRWEVVAGGLRNPYGLDFNPAGDLFTYDADMEWDVGAPWYRPTRVLHVLSGADFGWRIGTGTWPNWYPDGVPSLLDIGLGSPTAVRFGTKSRFPPRYRRSLFICDWSFGRILSVQMHGKGAGYTATSEPFVSGRPLNVTDIEFGPDGALYFLTGGRKTQSGLYRVSYVGELPAEEETPEMGDQAAVALRRKLEALQRPADAAATDFLWPHLGSEDPAIRHASRVALEHQPLGLWQARALAEKKPAVALPALLACARRGDADSQAALIARLQELPWRELDEPARIIVLRSIALALARHQPLADERLAAIEKHWRPLYPAATSPVNQLLCEILVYLHSPEVVSQTLPLLQQAKTQEEKLQYLYLLRNLPSSSWTLAERKKYFTAIREMRHFYGSNAMPRYQALLKADAAATLTDAERTALAPLLKEEPVEDSLPIALADRPVVRDWKMDDLIGSLELVGRGRNLAAGKNIYTAALCNRCHKFAGEGAAGGPDLTPLARRFSRTDMLLSILAPSHVIDEKYRSAAVVTTDGMTVTGMLLADDENSLTLLPNLLAPERTVRIPKGRVEEFALSLTSPMPAGLLNTFTKDEVLDLLAYLESAAAAEGPPK